MIDIRQLEIYKKICHSWEKNGRLYIGAAVLISILIGYAIAIEVPEEVGQVTGTQDNRSGMQENNEANGDTKGNYGSKRGEQGSKQGGYGNKKGNKGAQKGEGDDNKSATCVWSTRSVERPYALRDPFVGTVQKTNTSTEMDVGDTFKEPVMGVKRGQNRLLKGTPMSPDTQRETGARRSGWRQHVPALPVVRSENWESPKGNRLPRRDFQLCGILEGNPSLALVSIGGVSCALATGESYQGYMVRQITASQVLVDTPQGAQWYGL